MYRCRRPGLACCALPGSRRRGKTGIVDFYRELLDKLQRQFFTEQRTSAAAKWESARDRLRDINPEIEDQLHARAGSPARTRGANRADYDVVVDGSDNFATRYLSNDVCVFARKPNVYGSVFRFEGQTTVFAPHLGGPCYRCLSSVSRLRRNPSELCGAGALGVLPGIIGMLQAIETIKLIVGVGDLLIGRLIHFDALKVHFRELKLRRESNVPFAAKIQRSLRPLTTISFAARGKPERFEISVHELKRKMDARETFEVDPCARAVRIRNRPDRWSDIDSAGRNRRARRRAEARGANRCTLPQRPAQRPGRAPAAAALVHDVYNLEGGIDALAGKRSTSARQILKASH